MKISPFQLITKDFAEPDLAAVASMPQPRTRLTRTSLPRRSRPGVIAALVAFILVSTLPVSAQSFFPLRDVRPGLHGIGRTVFQGDRIEEFQVEILGVLPNVAPQQSVILARLSGGPLAETGVLQGMSGSPVYIDGKLLGAVALGFPFSKEPIAGIQPIESMMADATFTAPASSSTNPDLSHAQAHRTAQLPLTLPASSGLSTPFGNLTNLLTPLSLSGFTTRTLQAYAADFQKLGFRPEQGVSSGSPKSQQVSGTVTPGSMISVLLLSGDMNMSADGTVTYVNGRRLYAFGHRFLDTGSTELPFARSRTIAVIPSLNSSFKLSSPVEYVGTILSDRATAIAGEIGRSAHTIPLAVNVHSSATGAHSYHFQVVNDRLLTPFITQTVLFSSLDATERTLGVATLHLSGRIDFEGNLPPLQIRDMFVSDSGLAQQVAANAVVTLGFVLGAGFSNLHVKDIDFEIEPVEAKRQLHLAQVWASRDEVRPGESVTLNLLFQGENGLEITRTATYAVPVGAPLGSLDFTVSDANTLNFPDFAGLTQSALQSPSELINTVNAFRPSNAAYIRVWRQEPSFSVNGPQPGAEISDPPPSVMLVLADPSASATSNAALTLTRGSEITELSVPLSGYVLTGAKTVQVEVKE